jgi:hypothetical protein
LEQALAELGRDAKPLALKKHVKKKFGIDVTAEVARNYKKVLAKRAGARPVAATPPAPTSPTPQTPALPKERSGAGGISLADIQAVKELVGRVGPEPLRALIDLFSR